jgi:hypothetical protein
MCAGIKRKPAAEIALSYKNNTPNDEGVKMHVIGDRKAYQPAHQ